MPLQAAVFSSTSAKDWLIEPITKLAQNISYVSGKLSGGMADDDKAAEIRTSQSYRSGDKTSETGAVGLAPG